MMIDETTIATHDEPVGRERTNYILRLDLTADGMPGHFEQMWTRTDDTRRFELCCIPFFTYGLSLGDVITDVDDEGRYRVASKAGHRTIRFAIQDEDFAHRRHEQFHGSLAATGVLMELRGHARGYGAIDIATPAQADAVLAVLRPLAEAAILRWEWADPVVPKT